jgi:isopentenyl-diphosphate delta-isomerase
MADANLELIEYVDENGVPTGETAPKLDAHDDHTRMHAAFSCYVFNENGQFLVTQRALSKKVWPSVWTNSVCGHVSPGEAREDAIKRRSQYELGMEVKDIQVILPNYSYKTPPYNGIIENEFCPVFLARIDGKVNPNPDEVEDFKWLEWDEFIDQAKSDTDDIWSFWCKDQVKLFDDVILSEYIK